MSDHALGCTCPDCVRIERQEHADELASLRARCAELERQLTAVQACATGQTDTKEAWIAALETELAHERSQIASVVAERVRLCEVVAGLERELNSRADEEAYEQRVEERDAALADAAALREHVLGIARNYHMHCDDQLHRPQQRAFAACDHIMCLKARSFVAEPHPGAALLAELENERDALKAKVATLTKERNAAEDLVKQDTSELDAALADAAALRAGLESVEFTLKALGIGQITRDGEPIFAPIHALLVAPSPGAGWVSPGELQAAIAKAVEAGRIGGRTELFAELERLRLFEWAHQECDHDMRRGREQRAALLSATRAAREALMSALVAWGSYSAREHVSNALSALDEALGAK